MRYALIENGSIFTITEQDTLPAVPGLWVACGGAGQDWTYDGNDFHPPTITPAVDPAEWFIDVGPFFDRFGALKMAILTSPDAGVKAILADLQVRHWIDLKRPDVAQGLAYVGSVVTQLTPALQAVVMTTPVAITENLVLRKLYFK